MPALRFTFKEEKTGDEKRRGEERRTSVDETGLCQINCLKCNPDCLIRSAAFSAVSYSHLLCHLSTVENEDQAADERDGGEEQTVTRGEEVYPTALPAAQTENRGVQVGADSVLVLYFLQFLTLII